ncbi:AAA family ATPase [Niveibacterium microcysteis]|uniref:AAA family ATPase n=1 Tax=Niveibacterium microcysteis TaxID=2811415 RepID=A0ABX7M7P2_9RHOO|nr:bifunctional aminoglycoside phosphotransferase/ATP-binding protein [Niveibacterium microcysteis]QSI77576.1 AAA family ATPase [Niveibacterium microcysteis]
MKPDRPLPDADTLQRQLVEALHTPDCYPHPVGTVRLLETHISRVLLTGDFAYKLKKPVDLGFVDFSTLALRRRDCEDELRLNRRLAPELYLALVTFCGDPHAPRLRSDADAADVIDYAVQMREFPQDALLDRIAARGALTPDIIDAVADAMAHFHESVARAGVDDIYGTRTTVWNPVANIIAPLRASAQNADEGALLSRLDAWCTGEYARLETFFAERKRDGFVREGHGDLHLGNIALLHGRPQVFDCIEFSAALRWVDVICEVAFLFMDLEAHGRSDLAWRFLNRYLEHGGDYAGLAALRFHHAYRALVRAYVAGIRAAQPDAASHPQATLDRARYLACAARVLRKPAPQLLLMHGLSGSGKSYWAGIALELIGAVRVRSDVERKRLNGLGPTARSGSPVDGGIYAEAATRATYARLAELTTGLLAEGHSVIVDAAHLKRWQRDALRATAQALGLPCRILSCVAAPATRLARLQARAAAGLDASEASAAVLMHQREHSEPLAADEQAITLEIDSERATPELLRRSLATPSHAARVRDHAPS